MRDQLTQKEHNKKPCTRFGAMIAPSTLVMFGLMYLNTYAPDHVFFSETRAHMAVLMGATMAVVMLAFMWRMYENTTVTVVGAIAGNRRRRVLDARDDPAPLHRHLDQRAGAH